MPPIPPPPNREISRLMSRKSRTAPQPGSAIRAADLAILAEITMAMSAAHEPEQLLALVMQSAARLFKCEKSAIFFLRPESHQKMALARADGLSETYLAALQNFLLDAAGRINAIQGSPFTLVSDVRVAGLPAAQVEAADAESIRAYAELPLLAQGDVIGFLTLYFTRPHRFKPAEIELLKTFASQAALAITSARLYASIAHDLTRYSKQLRSLRAINRELTSTLDLEQLFEVVLERAIDYTNATAGCLRLYDAEKNKLVVTTHLGCPPEVIQLPESRSLSHIIAARTQRTGRISLVADVRHDPDYFESLNKNLSFLSLPIKHESQTRGVLTLESDLPEAFIDDHANFASQVAAQAAIAIENARLFQQITESRDRIEAVLNSTREGMLVIDASGRVAFANARIVELVQINRPDLEGQNLADLIKRPDLALPAKLGFTAGEILELLINLSQNLDVPPSKHAYWLNKPTPRFIERSGTPVIDEQKRVIGWVLVLRDITEEKRLEEAREELTGMIVHDLRSPMTSIIGSLKLIEDVALPTDKSGILQETLDVSLRSSKKIVMLIDSLLDIFKTEAGKLDLALQPRALKSIIQNSIEDFSAYAAQQHLHLIEDAPADLPPVLIDTEKIERVLTNLLDNALKFAPPHSEVLLRARALRLDEAVSPPPNSARFVLCEIVDNGPGIPAEYLEMIFERYTQVVGREGRRRGTGLGLAFCKMAVEAHGGQIWVENRPEGGSIFKFTLPIAPEV